MMQMWTSVKWLESARRCAPTRRDRSSASAAPATPRTGTTAPGAKPTTATPPSSSPTRPTSDASRSIVTTKRPSLRYHGLHFGPNYLSDCEWLLMDQRCRCWPSTSNWIMTRGYGGRVWPIYSSSLVGVWNIPHWYAHLSLKFSCW